MSSWSVVATAKERPEHLSAFVAWHLGEGAEKITLYYDDPSDSAFGRFSHLPQVEEVLCDADYWRNAGPRPNGLGARQSINATRCYRKSTSDWLLHCDIDEFVQGREPVAACFSRIPKNALTARLRPIERLFRDDDTGHSYTDVFRHQTTTHSPHWLSKIYHHPDQIQFGIRGHRRGKLFYRCGENRLTLHNHDALLDGNPMPPEPPFQYDFPEASLRLLHLFIFDYAHFLEKGTWKFARRPWRQKRDESGVALTKSEHRRKEIGQIFETGTPAEIRALFEDIFVFPPDRLQALAQFQTLETLNFRETLENRIARYFP